MAKLKKFLTKLKILFAKSKRFWQKWRDFQHVKEFFAPIQEINFGPELSKFESIPCHFFPKRLVQTCPDLSKQVQTCSNTFWNYFDKLKKISAKMMKFLAKVEKILATLKNFFDIFKTNFGPERSECHSFLINFINLLIL